MTEAAKRLYTPPRLIRPEAEGLAPEGKTTFNPAEGTVATSLYGAPS